MQPKASNTDRPRVLLVDDESSILGALRRLLRQEPYELVTAELAADALAIMEAAPVQLVITDHRMPGMDGTELLREVERRWPETVRVVLSGYSEVKAIIAAVNEGAVYKYLTKPWNDDEIKLHIRRALERYALVAENQRLTDEVLARNEELRRLNALLDQRAADATQGLACAQELLESLDAGVLVIDGDGLCVVANRRAKELLEHGLLAHSANAAMPPELLAVLFRDGRWDASPRNGQYVHNDGTLLWRVGPFTRDGEPQAIVVILWEVGSKQRPGGPAARQTQRVEVQS